MTATLSPTTSAPARDPQAKDRMPRPTRSPFRQRLSKADQKVSPYLYVAPFFLLFALVGLFPLLYTVNVSLFDWDLLSGQDEFVGAGNFVSVLQDDSFWKSIGNTLSIFLLSAIPQLSVALLVAYLLDRGLRAPTFWRMSVLIPFVVTPVATALIFSSAFNEADGLVNNVLNLVGIPDQEWKHDTFLSHLAIATMVNFRWTGYNALILLAAMQSVPRDLYESAAIDGAGAARRFFSITIPSIRPTLIFVIITATIVMGTLSVVVSFVDGEGRRQHAVSRAWARMLLSVGGVRVRLQGLENLDEILSVEGLDGVYIGPSDLSLALGCRPTFDDVDPPVAQAIEHVVARARAHGRVAGIHNGAPAAALRRIGQGFGFVTVSSDARLMAAGAQQVMAEMRAGQPPQAPAPDSGGY